MKKQRGFVLPIVLFLVGVLSFLILSVLEIEFLEALATKSYRNQIKAYAEAENKLLKMEEKISLGSVPENTFLLSDKICGVQFYQLEATGREKEAQVTLFSTFAKVGDLSQCDPQPKIKPGRQAWWRGI
jgi:hypothetical protein